MAKAMVKCLYCGETFDRNDPANEAVKIGSRRYAHKKCVDKQDQEKLKEDIDKDNFFLYCKELFKDDYNFLIIKKQSEKFVKDYQYTYSGMLKALKWFYEIQKGDQEKKYNNIGIIPYIYQNAYKYYYDLFLAQKKNEETDYKIEDKIITIESPRMWVSPPKLFDLGEDD